MDHYYSTYNPNDFSYFHNPIHEPPPQDDLWHHMEPYNLNHLVISPINPSSNLLNPLSKLCQELIQMCHCSYYCIWKPSPASNPSSSSSSSLQSKGMIYNGGDVNALIQDNTESTKIKLLLQRYETQHFIPSSETGLAGVAMEFRKSQSSYVHDIIDPTHQIFLKDASIQTLLWVPLHEGGQVMELGTTHLVQGIDALLAQVYMFLKGPTSGDGMVQSTSNSVHMVDFDTNLFCLDTNMPVNTTPFDIMDTLEMPFNQPNPSIVDYNFPHNHDSNNISIGDLFEHTIDNSLYINNNIPTQLHHDGQVSIDHIQSLVSFAPSLEQTHELPTLSNVNQQQYLHNDAPHHASSTEDTFDTHFSSPLSSCLISSPPLHNSSPISPMTSWSSSHSISSPNSLFKPWTPLQSKVERRHSHPHLRSSLLKRCLLYWLPYQTSLESIHSNMDVTTLGASTHSISRLLPVKGITELGSSTRSTQFSNEGSTQHVLSERKRRQRQKENFNALKALVPNITKRDKVAILQHSIRFIEQLKHRIEELEQQQKDTIAKLSNGFNDHIGNISCNQPFLDHNQDHQSEVTYGFPLPNGARYLVTRHAYDPPSTFHLAMSVNINMKDINDVIMNVFNAIKSKGLECFHLKSMHFSSSRIFNIKLSVKEKEVKAGTLSSNTLVEIEDWWRQLTLAIETT